MKTAGRTLRRILGQRIVFVAFAAILLQFGYTIYRYGWSTSDLADSAIEKVIDGLTGALKGNPENIVLPENIAVLYSQYPRNYGFGIRRTGGGVIASANSVLFADIALTSFPPGGEISIRDSANGASRIFESQPVAVNGSTFTVSVVAIGDPAGLIRAAFISEIIDHVMLPIVPLTLFLLGSLWYILNQSLRPVEAAADAAQRVDPIGGGVHLNLQGAPLEIAALGHAVNSLLDRLEEAIRSHREFASDVAHELRTPLASMLLELESSPNPAMLRARAEALSMSRLIDQLLSISRLEGLERSKFAPVDLAILARSVAAQIAPSALSLGVELEVITPANVTVKGQAEVIESALRNLLENAIRVAPAKSSVEIQVGPGPILAVRDQGPGIPKEQLAGLFERFRQGDRETHGKLGLGLAITKRAIELHGGQVKVDSKPGRGSTFTLVFPSQRN